MFENDAGLITRIDFQWKNLHHKKWTVTSNTRDRWAEIGGYRDATGENPFYDVCQLALKILSLPHSNADVERLFSNMNCVKTKLRNRLILKTVNAILGIKYGLRRHRKCCHDYQLPDSVVQKIETLKSYEYQAFPKPSTSQEHEIEEALMDWDELIFE